jgi:hypothetical protein
MAAWLRPQVSERPKVYSVQRHAWAWAASCATSPCMRALRSAARRCYPSEAPRDHSGHVLATCC